MKIIVYTIPSKQSASLLMNSDNVHKHKLFDLPDPKRGRGWRWLVAGYISAVYSEINFGREIQTGTSRAITRTKQ